MSYSLAGFTRPTSLMVTSFSFESLFGSQSRMAGNTSASVAWPSANQAIYVPILIPQTATFIKAFWANGTAVAGNVDVGLYNSSFVRVASTGSTAQSGTSDLQEVDITDFTIGPGHYYLGISASSGSATFYAYTATDAARLPYCGVLQEASALPLPAPATPVAVTQLILPLFGFSRRTLVA